MKSFIFVVFTVTLTALISSQNFFFQDTVKNGISQKDVYAPKTITVIDTRRTEMLKKEAGNKVEPILTPTEDNFIRVNFSTLQNAIREIRAENIPLSEQKQKINVLMDLPNSGKDFVVDFLLTSDEPSLNEAFAKANQTLEKVLEVGITESDYQANYVTKIIKQNMVRDVSKRQVSVISALLEQVIVPNLVVDEFATNIARQNAQSTVKPYEMKFQKGDVIIRKGEPVTNLKQDALRQAGMNVYELDFKALLSMYLIVVLGVLIYLAYMKYFEDKFLEHTYLSLSASLTGVLVLFGMLLPSGFSPYILPIPAYVFILAIFTSPRIAFVAGTVLLMIMAVGFHYSSAFLCTFTLLMLVSAIAISKIRYSKRMDLLKVGIFVSVAGAVIVMSIFMLEKCLVDVNNSLILKNTCFVFINGILSSVIVLGTLPIFESTFKIITPYGLSELADVNQPLLKRLQFDAPGTYHHSLMVANLSEAAAEAIGANPVLARVGAMYHDIGKLKRPLFFVENQSYFKIENPHNNFTPRISKMIITSHTKDGLELAKEYSLPQEVQDFIIQHHGEGLASYFYNQALKEEGAENVKEEQFRYTGPKPNKKETAILMLADAVESAVRAMDDSEPDEVQKVIDKIIMERIIDGQLSDSPLTLLDIKNISATFNRVLRGMKHNRIKYEDDEFEKKLKQLEEKEDND
ncbi:HDIG domain-containing protein [bacterium]|nr:HDIG domain-containing protein [bacterium]